jgi:glyoxylase-like metal-dependent hydrolase (beta-lactamase superfamily II)
MAGAVVQVHERIWQIHSSYGGDGMVMVYLVRGSKMALVDTGVVTSPLNDIKPGLKSLGVDMAEVAMILNTHGHHDHSGGNVGVKEEAPNAQIHLHEADREFLYSHEKHRTFMTEYLRHYGREELGATRQATIMKLLPEGDAGVDRALTEGDRVDLGSGVELTVIHSPGHTPGSVCFYWEQEKLALSGDSIQGRGSRSGGWPLYFDAASYRRSLERLLDVPMETLCLGHGFHVGMPFNPPVRRGAETRQLVEESISLHQAIDDAVRARLRAQPDASNLEVAQGVTMDLLTRIPAQIEPELRITSAGGPTLWAHIRDARAALT